MGRALISDDKHHNREMVDIMTQLPVWLLTLFGYIVGCLV